MVVNSSGMGMGTIIYILLFEANPARCDVAIIHAMANMRHNYNFVSGITDFRTSSELGRASVKGMAKWKVRL